MNEKKTISSEIINTEEVKNISWSSNWEGSTTPFQNPSASGKILLDNPSISGTIPTPQIYEDIISVSNDKFVTSDEKGTVDLHKLYGIKGRSDSFSSVFRLQESLTNIKRSLKGILYNSPDILERENIISLVNQNFIKLVVFLDAQWNENLIQVLHHLHMGAYIHTKEVLGYNNAQIKALYDVVELVISSLPNMREESYFKCVELLENADIKFEVELPLE